MSEYSVDRVKRYIYGDILVSSSINKALRKWRKLFGVSQVDLAKWMGISPSVISEYESERRRTPGTRFLKKFVDSLIELDLRKGGRVVSLVLNEVLEQDIPEPVLIVRDFLEPFPASELIEVVDGVVIANEDLVDKVRLYGFTLIDSLKAILLMSGNSFYKLFGRSTERAVIFTNVSTGRSPMVAIRVYPLKPRMVVVHRPRTIDKLSIKLARKERILYILSRMESADELANKLLFFSEKLIKGS